MPVATIDPSVYERFPIKSAPADPKIPGDEEGYVMLRPLPFGLKLIRSDKALKMRMVAGPQDRKEKGGDKSAPIDLETANAWAAAHDFAYCIGEHNLLSIDGQKIDFANPMIFKTLNPKIGSELVVLINKLNEDEDEESAEDLIRRALSSSGEESASSGTDSST